MLERYDSGLVPPGISAEIIAERWSRSRSALDEIAVRSPARAAAPADSGAFDAELAPCGETVADEGVRRGTDLATLAGLRTAFRDDGVVTAGNSSQISDGAAALLVTTSEVAARHGWRPLARFHSFATAGVDPVTMLTAPIPATERVLRRAGLRLDEIGVVELNEAFASVVGAWLAETGADPDRVNPRGGAIALGHPLGGSGARLMTTLVHEMAALGSRYGLQTMCEGGGMANATVLELL
jgi:acetyl-CoA acyltransferase